MTTKKEENMGARSFAHLLTQIDEGRLHAELSEAIREASSKLYDHANNYGGKAAKGELTLKLSLSAESNGTVSIVGEVKTKMPRVSHPRTITWIDPTGALVLSNPKQINLPLREVPAAGPTRTVDETAEKRSL